MEEDERRTAWAKRRFGDQLTYDTETNEYMVGNSRYKDARKAKKALKKLKRWERKKSRENNRRPSTRNYGTSNTTQPRQRAPGQPSSRLARSLQQQGLYVPPPSAPQRVRSQDPGVGTISGYTSFDRFNDEFARGGTRAANRRDAYDRAQRTGRSQNIGYGIDGNFFAPIDGSKQDWSKPTTINPDGSYGYGIDGAFFAPLPSGGAGSGGSGFKPWIID